MNTIRLDKQKFLDDIFNYEQSSEWKYKDKTPALIDFYADWCGPCKMIAPVLEDLAEQYAGKIKIYKVDTEKEQELSAIFGIRSIPSLLFIPVDDQPQMLAGALPKNSLEKMIEKILLKEPVS